MITFFTFNHSHSQTELITCNPKPNSDPCLSQSQLTTNRMPRFLHSLLGFSVRGYFYLTYFYKLRSHYTSFAHLSCIYQPSYVSLCPEVTCTQYRANKYLVRLAHNKPVYTSFIISHWRLCTRPCYKLVVFHRRKHLTKSNCEEISSLVSHKLKGHRQGLYT